MYKVIKALCVIVSFFCKHIKTGLKHFRDHRWQGTQGTQGSKRARRRQLLGGGRWGNRSSSNTSSKILKSRKADKCGNRPWETFNNLKTEKWGKYDENHFEMSSAIVLLFVNVCWFALFVSVDGVLLNQWWSIETSSFSPFLSVLCFMLETLAWNVTYISFGRNSRGCQYKPRCNCQFLRFPLVPVTVDHFYSINVRTIPYNIWQYDRVVWRRV